VIALRGLLTGRGGRGQYHEVKFIRPHAVAGYEERVHWSLDANMIVVERHPMLPVCDLNLGLGECG
jgi:hypothetical protein